MPYGKKRSVEEVEALKQKIALLLTQAIPHKTIYEKLGIPKRTFYTYYDSLAKDFQNMHLKKANRIIYGFSARSMNRIKDLQAKYQEVGDPRILRDAQFVEKCVMDIYKDLGIVEKVADKFEINGMQLVVNFPEAFKKKVKNK